MAASTEERRAHWERIYGGKASDELSWFEARPETSLAMIKRSGLGRRAAILDVGGGDSRMVDALLEASYGDLTILDVSQAALARARARLGPRAERIQWLAADVTAFRPRRTYDLWHDRAVFHFLTEEVDRRGYLAALRAALGPGGRAILATFSPAGPERCSGLPVRRYSVETLAAELGPEFALEESLERVHATPSGREQSFLHCRFVRAEPGA